MSLYVKNKNQTVLFSLVSAVAVGMLIGWWLHARPVFAQSSNEVGLAASVYDQNGKSLVDGNYDIRFTLYSKDRTVSDPYPSNADAGAKVWEETQKVAVKDGIFRVFLGTTNPLPAGATLVNGDYYIGMRIGNDSELVPRKKIAAVPFALNANSVQGAVPGTTQGNLLLLGKGGKVDIKSLPTGTGSNQLVLGNDSRLSASSSTPSFTSLTVSGLSTNGFVRTTGGNGTFTVEDAINLAGDVTGVLPVANGGTGLSTAPTNGQISIGNAASGYTLASLTAGPNVTITDGDGTITIASTAPAYTAGGTLLSLSGGNIFSLKEGTLTDNRICTYSTSVGLVCDTLAGSVGATYSAGNGLSLVGTTFSLPTVSIANGGTNLTTTPGNGQLLIGNGSGYSLSSLTQGGGIIITNGSGTVTISSTLGTSVDLTSEVSDVLPVVNGGTGASSLADLFILGTDTTGNYVQSIANGNGILGGNGGSEGATLTLGLGPLTADWNQTGAYTISLNNSGAGLKMLENGSSPTLFGIFDVADLSGSDKTYTFPDATGTVVLGSGSANQVAYWSGTNTLSSEAQLSVSRGGTGLNGATAANGTLLIGNGTGYSLATLTQGSGITVTNGSGTITVANADPGSAQNIFKTVAVSGQSDVVADQNNDTLTIAAGSNITITTDAAGDSVTISAASGTAYTAGGSILQLTGSTFSLKEGTLTDGQICTYSVVSGIVCNTAPGGVGVNYWTDSGATTYLSSTTDNVAIGGSTIANSHFFFDVSGGNRLVFGGTTVNDGNETSLLVTNPTASRTITLQDNSGVVPLGTTGNNLLFTTSGATTVTLPVTGTLATLDGSEVLTNKTLSTGSTWNGNAIDISSYTNLAVSGSLLKLTGDTLSVKEGTLTDTRICVYSTTAGIVCDTTAGSVGVTYDAGSGLALTGTTFSIGSPLTADWNQTGAYTISLNNSGAGLKMLENGSSPTLFGIFDVADLSGSDKTYTFPDATGTVVLGSGSANQVAYWSGTNTLSSEAQLSVSRGGTGAGTFTSNGVFYGNGSGILQVTAQGGANTVLVANAGTPSFSSAVTIGTSVTSPTVNATSALQLGGVNINTGGTLSNVAYLNQANAFTAMQTITPAVNTSPLVISGYSLTGSNTQPLLNLAGTWNTSGLPTGIKLNIADTASDANALLLDLQVGGTSKFKVDKSGNVIIGGSINVLNVTALGTITNGIWNATPIGAQYGGTGIDTHLSTGVPSITSGVWSVNSTLPVVFGGTGLNGSAATNGQLLIGNGSGFALATLTQGSGITVTNGSGTITIGSTLGTSVDLTSEVSDVLPVANGGTGASSLNDLIALGMDTTGNYVATISGNSQITVSGSGSESAAVFLSIANDSIGDTQLAFNTGQNLTTASSPSFSGLTVSGLSTAGIVTNTSGGVLGTVATVPVANGGTNATTIGSAGSVPYSTSTAYAFSAVGTTGQALISGGAGAPTWFAPTAGSVLFAGASGILSQDNANYFYDATNHRLGLGTVTPAAPFELYGGSAADVVSMITAASSTYDPLLSFRTGSTPAIQFSLGVDSSDSNKFKIANGSGLGVGGDALSIDSTGTVNIANLNLGAQTFDTDAGMVSWIDMPVSATPSAGTVESYSAQIDGNPLLTVYAEADNAGGIQNSGVSIGNTSLQTGARFAVTQSSTSTTAGNLYGLYNSVSDTGVVTSGTDTTYGDYLSVTRTGATGGTINNYGQYVNLTADNAGAGTSTNYGQYVNVSGADTNYAGVFMGGNAGIGTATPTALLSVGSSSQFQVNSSGAIAAAAGVTSSGTVTFSGLSTAGIVTNTSGGVLGTIATVPVANGGTGITTAGLTGVPAISGGTWSVDTNYLALNHGGTNNTLTASNGGIVYSDASKLNILSGTATAGLALVSGASTAPTWYAPTLGSVLFAGTNGALSQDNANYFYDATNHRLGLGTVTPAKMFSLYGVNNDLRLGYDSSNYVDLSSTSTGNLSVTSSAATQAVARIGNNTAQDASIQFDGAVNDYFAGLDDTTGSYMIGSGFNVQAANAFLTVTSTGLTGIGTSGVPASLLSIGGTTGNFQVNSSGAITAAAGITSSGTITFSGLNTAGIVTNTSGGVLGTVATVPVANGGTGITTAGLTGVPTIAAGTWSVASSLGIALGGTNTTTIGSAGSIPYSTSTAYAFSAVGTAGQALISGGAGAPTWFAPTAGSVLFAGASGILSQDNANYFYDATNHRLGLGTVTPAAMLSLYGTNNDLRLGYDSSNYVDLSSTSTGQLNITNSSATQAAFKIGNNTAQDASIQFDGAVNDYFAGLDDTTGSYMIGSGFNVQAANAFLTVTSTGLTSVGGAPNASRFYSLESGAKTAADYAGYFENTSTNTTTDAVNKYGIYATSTGTFTGSGGTATNNYGLYVATTTGGDNNYDIYAASGAYLSTAGTWTNAPSYRRYKDTFTPTTGYLDKLMTLDVFEWQYKDEIIDGANRYQADSNRHTSPFLDDFYRVFGLGTENGFNIQDLAGVAIASVKELNQRFINQNAANTTAFDTLNLQTSENITTVAQLQSSVDTQFTIASESINQLKTDSQAQSKDIDTLKTQMTTTATSLASLETSVTALAAKSAAFEAQIATIADFYTTLNLKNVLSTDKNGNLDLLAGNFHAGQVTTGGLTIEITDTSAKTIGTATILPVVTDLNHDGKDDDTGSDGESIFVPTKAATATAKIFTGFQANPNAYTWTTKEVDVDKTPTGFTIHSSAPITKPVDVDWWIVESR